MTGGSCGERYADPAALAALVEPDRVHRDVYVDREVFALERARLWRRAWLYAGHASQVPAAGDRLRLSLAGEPAWLEHLGDGRLAVRRARVGPAAPVTTHVHRGFVFARLADDGPSFADWCGQQIAVLDNLVDRSPDGALRVAGAGLRVRFRANWKLYLENVNDAVHPVSAHAAAADAATAVWHPPAPDAPPPMSMQQMLPFASGYRFFQSMGARTLPNGHSLLGTHASIHSGYAGLPGYEAALAGRHGAAGAARVLAFSPQNAVFYPGLAAKASPMVLRVLCPLAVDLTELQVWALEPAGAPDVLRQRAVMYNRLVFSPMSVLSHDDLHLFESTQRALVARGNPWVSLHRDFDPDEHRSPVRDVAGTDEALMRNQFAAWISVMTGVQN